MSVMPNPFWPVERRLAESQILENKQGQGQAVSVPATPGVVPTNGTATVNGLQEDTGPEASPSPFRRRWPWQNDYRRLGKMPNPLWPVEQQQAQIQIWENELAQRQAVERAQGTDSVLATPGVKLTNGPATVHELQGDTGTEITASPSGRSQPHPPENYQLGRPGPGNGRQLDVMGNSLKPQSTPSSPSRLPYFAPVVPRRGPPPGQPYVRPAVFEDAEEIAHIINWYLSVDFTEVNPDFLEPQEVCFFINVCNYRKLPFLVIVQPVRPGSLSHKVCGLAYVDVVQDDANEDSTGDLRVYVSPMETGYGFGTLLVDCTLSIVDEHYRRQWFVEWLPVGSIQLQVLRLKQVVCIISYPAQIEGKYAFIWRWLMRRFGFKFLSEKRKDRAKFGHQENVLYLWLPTNGGRREFADGPPFERVEGVEGMPDFDSRQRHTHRKLA